jgi:GNAT superfamily N-acetyltransferase
VDGITLRRATADDFAFFFALHKESLGPYVDQVWGWEDDDQRAYLERNLVLPHTRVIVVNGSDVGRLDLEDHCDELFLALIEIAAEHRCRGIGGQLIQALLNDGLRGRQASTTQRAASQYSGLPALPAARFHEVLREGVAPETRIRMVAQPS